MAGLQHPGRAAAIALFEQHLPTGEVADRTGADARTVKRWRAEWKAANGKTKGTAPVGVSASAPARARASEPADEAPEPTDEAAPPIPDVEQNPVGHWRAKLAQAEGAVQRAITAGHTQAASAWARIADDRSASLSKAIESDRHRREREDRAAIRDPRDLARRVVARLPTLMGMLDDEDRKLVDAVRQAAETWTNNRGATP